MRWMRYPFRKAGEFLVDRFLPYQSGRGDRRLYQELTALSAGKRASVREYYISKAETTLMILTLGLLAAGVGFLVSAGHDRRIENQSLIRPGYGAGDRNEELAVQVAGEDEPRTLEITVQDRKYTEKEQDAFLERAAAQLDELLPGENGSLDEVRQNLVFPEKLEAGAVTLSWMTVPYGIIDDDGSILHAEDENGTLVEIQGTLTCGEKESIYTVFAKIFPPVLSEEESLVKSIRKEAEHADQQDRYKESIELPTEVNGKVIEWMHPEENPVPAILALTLLAAVCIYIGKDQKVHKQAEERSIQLALDYPDLMWKLSMLIGAGLTIKGAFARVVDQYQKEKNQKTMPRYVYEEAARACYEMQSGIPEAEAYERFGRRCQLPEYVRLGSYLSQNLKKGSRGLTDFLTKEAESSLEERKNHARKIGEQAGTKLLMPMVLMLGIVLVVLMVPAFLSF